MPLYRTGIIISVCSGRVKRNFAVCRQISKDVGFAALDGGDQFVFLYEGYCASFTQCGVPKPTQLLESYPGTKSAIYKIPSLR